ncbi:hypothetical protein Tco_1509717 [Tanacetum coccineum]
MSSLGCTEFEETNMPFSKIGLRPKFLTRESVEEAKATTCRREDDWKEKGPRRAWGGNNVDWWADPKRVEKSAKNADNRAKKRTTSYQGSKSFAQGRHEYPHGRRYAGTHNRPMHPYDLKPIPLQVSRHVIPTPLDLDPINLNDNLLELVVLFHTRCLANLESPVFKSTCSCNYAIKGQFRSKYPDVARVAAMLPHAFQDNELQEPTWNMDTGQSSHLARTRLCSRPLAILACLILSLLGKWPKPHTSVNSLTLSQVGSDGDPVSDSTLYRSLAGALQYLTFTRDWESPMPFCTDYAFYYRSVTAYTDADCGWMPWTVRDTNFASRVACPLTTSTSLSTVIMLVLCYLTTNLFSISDTKHSEIDIHFRDYVAFRLNVADLTFLLAGGVLVVLAIIINWCLPLIDIRFNAWMKSIKDQVNARTIGFKSDKEIIVEVTKSTNREHESGVGRRKVEKAAEEAKHEAELAKQEAKLANERAARVELVLDKFKGHYSQQQTQAGGRSFTPPPLPTTFVPVTVSTSIPDPYSDPYRYYKVMNPRSSRMPNDDEDGDDKDGNDEDGNANNEYGNGSDESLSESDDK